MITLSPGCLCDVCAEEYGSRNLPHSIPCGESDIPPVLGEIFCSSYPAASGHVLCLNCCNNIVKKTPSRLSPVCPFCRVQFTADSVRLIRIDCGSGFVTPKRVTSPAHDHHDVGEDDVLLFNPGTVKTRAEAKRLESKVAQVAAKKCSVEEVTTLHRELQDWLQSDKLDEQVRRINPHSLFSTPDLLSADLVPSA